MSKPNGTEQSTGDDLARQAPKTPDTWDRGGLLSHFLPTSVEETFKIVPLIFNPYFASF